MTKSIEEQAEAAASEIKNFSWSNHHEYKKGYIDAVKARDAQQSAVVTELREALKKISDYSTLDGEKYNSYQDGWHGVADFAKREFTKADQLLKEMNINKGE